MPGLMIHLAEGSLVEKDMIDLGLLTNAEEIHMFRDGLLLPDSIERDRKRISHFWDQAILDHSIKSPNLDTFRRRYLTGKFRDEDPLRRALLLGYYVHLHLDVQFFQRYIASRILYTDANGKEEVLADRITHTIDRRTGAMITLMEMFSDAYLYGDYTKLNSILMREYSLLDEVNRQIELSRMGEQSTGQIELSRMGEQKAEEYLPEIPFYPMNQLRRELASYRDECVILEEKAKKHPELLAMKILDIESLKSFLTQVSLEFVTEVLEFNN